MDEDASLAPSPPPSLIRREGGRIFSSLCITALGGLAYALEYLDAQSFEKLVADIRAGLGQEVPLLADPAAGILHALDGSLRHPGPAGMMYLWICLPLAESLASPENEVPGWLRQLARHHPVLTAMVIGLCLSIGIELATSTVSQSPDALKDIIVNQAAFAVAAALQASAGLAGGAVSGAASRIAAWRACLPADASMAHSVAMAELPTEAQLAEAMAAAARERNEHRR